MHKWHHYFVIYEKYLARFRDTSPTILELGVSGAAGWRCWRAHSGQPAGVRHRPRSNSTQHEDVATKIFIGDQRDRNFLRDVIREIGHPDV